MESPRSPPDSRNRYQYTIPRTVRHSQTVWIAGRAELTLLLRNHRPSLLPPSLEPLYLHLTLVLSLASYSRAVYLIINAFCSYLGINCLTIPYPNKAVEGWQPLPALVPTSPSPAAEEERELEMEMDRLSSPTKRIPSSSGGGLLNVVPSPFKGMLGSGEGRKRSNTSERERGLSGAGGGQAGDGRRVAKVFSSAPTS